MNKNFKAFSRSYIGVPLATMSIFLLSSCSDLSLEPLPSIIIPGMDCLNCHEQRAESAINGVASLGTVEVNEEIITKI